MSTFTERLLSPEPWEGIVMGNHALARAMIEAGTKVITSYPGSPTPEIAEALQTVPEVDRPFYFEFSTNEKVALEVAFGASVNGNSSTVFFKSVGLNVAADSAVQLALMELTGGMVIILGDDPGANSSQNEQDNRRFAQMAYIPVLEPGNPQEAHDMYLDALAVSKDLKLPVILRMTTHVCHAKQLVRFGKAAGEVPWKTDFSKDHGPYLPITKLVFPMKKKALMKLESLSRPRPGFSAVKLHSFSGGDTRRPGIITYGLPLYSVLENIEDSGFSGDVLQLRMVFPLPEEEIIQFLKSHPEVLIVEELDRVLETGIKALAFDHAIPVRLFARKGIDALMGELNPVRTRLILHEVWPDLFPVQEPAGVSPETVPRIPQMCPGCGHRSAFHAIKKALPPGTITVGDIGCHSLGFFPPYNMGEVVLCMGHSSGTAAGLAVGNITRPVVAFLGDSTFFHAGMPAIINAITHQHNFTLVIMENGTTAMTGHQPHAGSKEMSVHLSIKEVLESFGVSNILRIDTYNQKQLTDAVIQAIDERGFSVIIATHPCMLKFTREARAKGPFHPKKMEVLADTCVQSHDCVSDFACPSFSLNEDGSVQVNKGLCIGDGSCRQVCPVSALRHEAKERDEVKK